MDVLNQAKNLIENSKNILILPSSDLHGDNLGSALALFFTLKKMGKNVNISIKNVPEKFKFLTELQPLSSREFVIFVDAQGKEISDMRYEKNDQGLKIYLNLNNGELSEKDVSFSTSSQSPDLLITLGIDSQKALKDGYQSQILNISNKSSNENFGHVNLIEENNSLAEILTSLIKTMNAEDLLDENIATCLLAGLVYNSQNFRNQKTGPKTFETSAFLIEKGGNHQKIVQHLYKQKSLPQIKILGRILEKLEKLDEQKQLYSSCLTKEDFQECQAKSTDLGLAVEELKFNFRYLDNLLILWESHASPVLIKGIFYSSQPDLAKKILENFEGVSKGEGVLFLVRDDNLARAQEKVLKVL